MLEILKSRISNEENLSDTLAQLVPGAVLVGLIQN